MKKISLTNQGYFLLPIVKRIFRIIQSSTHWKFINVNLNSIQNTQKDFRTSKINESNEILLDQHDITILIGYNHLNVADLCTVEAAEQWALNRLVCR